MLRHYDGCNHVLCEQTANAQKKKKQNPSFPIKLQHNHYHQQKPHHHQRHYDERKHRQ